MAEEKEVKKVVKKTAAKTAPKKVAKTADEVVVAAPKEPKKAAPKATAKKASAGNKVAPVQSRLQARYIKEIVPAMVSKYNYKSVMQVPHIDKIVINMGVGEAAANSKLLDDAVNDLMIIAGQKPVITKSKKSIATYKVREGQPIGCKVTLRGLRMYDFLDKLVTIALPRVRDFRGVSKNAFDGRGNYTLGVKEQLIFAEIDYDKITKIRGMDIVIVTTAKSDEEAYTLLEELGMPFKR